MSVWSEAAVRTVSARLAVSSAVSPRRPVTSLIFSVLSSTPFAVLKALHHTDRSPFVTDDGESGWGTSNPLAEGAGTKPHAWEPSRAIEEESSGVILWK